ncbi:MAG TPA: TMEM175 family protein [Thermoplasmata archaeon]
MEAFSDGVFAFAITLLALNLRDPAGNGVSLSQGLINEWPSFFALVTSFVTVLIMWMNHHNMFNYIRKIDRRLMLLNGVLLLFVVLTVFNTSLVADHIQQADSNVAATLYAGTFFVLAIVWNGLWWYCTSGRRLLGRDVTDAQANTITRQYRVAPLSYGVALVIAPFSGLASVAVILAVAGFFAITATISD